MLLPSRTVQVGGRTDCSPTPRGGFLSPAGITCVERPSLLRPEETLPLSSPPFLLSRKPPSGTDVSLQLGAWPRSPRVFQCLQPLGWALSIAQWVILPWPSGTIQVPGPASPLRLWKGAGCWAYPGQHVSVRHQSRPTFLTAALQAL